MKSRTCLSCALIVALLLVVPSVGAQQVTGRVTDQQSGEPLAAVQVFIVGSGIGALTQQNGRYLLLNVPPGTHTLSAERIGYRSVTRQIMVGAGATVVQEFVLNETALGLDEIIVTGTPGGTQRRAIGNAVTAVQASEVAQTVAVAGLQDLLSGRSPGVQFTRVSGNVGTGSGIDIRGVGSFSLSSDPLIYVDGVRVNNDSQSGPMIADGREVNPLDDFNPQDIESVEIIKGPAAATLYGTEASAGVIQIITKRGAEGAPQFDLSVRQGVNYLSDPAGKLGTRWSCENKFAPPCREGEGLITYNPYEEANLLIQQGAFPWPTKNVFQNGLSQSYNLSVRGGTQAVRYFLSGNYDDEEGMVFYNRDKTFRMRANVSVIFNENFSLDVSSGYVEGRTRFGEPAQRDGGEWTDMQWGTGYCIPRIGGADACPRLLGFQEHLPSDVAKLRTTREYSRFTASGTLNFNFGGWLTSRAVFGLDRGEDENIQIWPKEVEQSPVYQESIDGKIVQERPLTRNVSLDLSSTARFDVTDSWSTATSVGAQYFVKSLSAFSVTGTGFAHPSSRTVNQTPASNATLGFDFIENKSLGFYVQEELSWNDRLFLTGAVRFDDNSAFGADFEAVTYPKLAATWVISEENFWNLDLVNSLRLRGAWGKAGRQPDAFAGAFQYGVISAGGGTTALNPLAPGNRDVGPETSTELELGFDVALLDDRFAAEFTWFTEKNEDALLGIGLAPSEGFRGAAERNLGRLDNWGWEVSVHSRIYESPSFSFNLDLTASHVDNEIKELGEYPGGVTGPFPGSNAILIGLPYPNWPQRFAIVSAQLDPNGPYTNLWGERISAMCDKGVRLGDGPKYGIVPGGDIVPCPEAGEHVLMGPAFDRYVFSVSPRISLFDNSVVVHVLLDGKHGRMAHEGQAGAGCQTFSNCLETRAENSPITRVDRTINRGALYRIYDASFWKLREIGVRYNLPESLVSRIGADRASLALFGRELGVIWRKQSHVGSLPIPDPEASNSSRGTANWRATPPLTSLSATLRLTF